MLSDKDRLDEFLRIGETIEFFHVSDKEHAKLCWRVFGVPPTNEIFVRAEVGALQFVKAAPSLLAYPLMEDRRFGIDVADKYVAEKLSIEVWEENSDAIAAGLEKES